MFGIGSTAFYWLGFSAHAVEFDKPFLSSTGYRSFLGVHADPVLCSEPMPIAWGGSATGPLIEPEWTWK
ncbi:MAG: hypothetical protein Kow0060_20440 [Methylohalobius crimeensis]